jgi:hypothetical protein
MDLERSSGRGAYKLAYCRELRLAAVQWCDSKVVNCVSSYVDLGVSTVHRRIGSDRRTVTCPSVIVHYQKNMGAVDKTDQMRGHFGGFASQSHFKKWYKKTLMAILDCMLLNALHLWNMSADKVDGRQKLERFQFMQVVAHELLRYKTESLMSPVIATRSRPRSVGQAVVGGTADNEPELDDDDHDDGLAVSESVGNKRCVVCSLETSHYRRQVKNRLKNTEEVEEGKRKLTASYQGVRKHVSTCTRCSVSAHNSLLSHGKYIHALFPGMTCMQILHSATGKEIWNVVRSKVKNSSSDDFGEEKTKVTVNYRHRVVKDVRKLVEAACNEEE